MSLFGLFERRSNPLESATRPLTDAALVELFGGAPGDAGVVVTEQGSLAMSAVYRAVSLISGLGGALPIHTFKRGTREQVPNTLVEEPHPDMTAYEFWRLTFVHRLLWGNFVALKRRDRSGRIAWLQPVAPSTVRFGKSRPTEGNQTGKIFEITLEDGTREAFIPYEVFHLPGLGYDGVCGLSPIRLAAQGIGMSLAAEKYGARLFGSGNLLSGLLKTTQRLEQPQAEALQARWRQKMGGLQSAHEVAVLDSGAEFQSLTMPNDEAQLLESRHFQISEIGRFFGVPAFLMGDTTKSTSWGTGLEQQALGFVQFDLHPQWLAPTEQRITQELLPSGRDAKYKVEGLLRGDSTARAEFYRAMRELGVMNADEIRDLEDMQPIADGGGKEFWTQPNAAAVTEQAPGDETEGVSDAASPADEQ